MMKRAIASLVCGGLTVSAFSNLIQNGSFEEGDYTGGAFTHVDEGSDALTGWTIGTFGVDWHDSEELSPAYNQQKMLDLNGNGGWIEQSFATTAGQLYHVRFALCGPTPRTHDFVDPRTVEVEIAGGSWSFSQPASDFDNLKWSIKSFDFVAIGETSTLRFNGNTSGNYWGPVIDYVEADAVPEPGTLLAFAGCLWLVRRRRR